MTMPFVMAQRALTDEERAAAFADAQRAAGLRAPNPGTIQYGDGPNTQMELEAAFYAKEFPGADPAGTKSAPRYFENGVEIQGTPDWAGGTTRTGTSGTADQTSINADAERARQARAAADERARLDAERAAALNLAARINAPTTPPRVFTLGEPMINANRPVEDTRVMTGDNALTLDQGGSYNPPQQLPVNNTTALAPAQWQKYLPYALAALALFLLVVAMKKKSGAAS